MNSVPLLFLLLLWYMDANKSGKVYIYVLLPNPHCGWHLEWGWEYRSSEHFWDVTPVPFVWEIITFSSLLFLLVSLFLTFVLEGWYHLDRDV